MTLACISLRAGEELRVGGAAIRARRDAALWVEADAGVLHGDQVLRPGPGDGRLRQLYLLLQEAFTGDLAATPATIREAIHLADEFVRLECEGEQMPLGFSTIVADVRLGRLQDALQGLRALIRQVEDGAGELCGFQRRRVAGGGVMGR